MCVCVYVCACVCVCVCVWVCTYVSSLQGKGTVATLFSHCCYTAVTVVTLLLHCAVALLMHCITLLSYFVTVVALLSHGCYTVVTLLLHCCYTVVTLLSIHCCCSVDTQSSQCYHTVVTLLSHLCYTFVTLLSHCCYTAITLLIHCRCSLASSRPHVVTYLCCNHRHILTNGVRPTHNLVSTLYDSIETTATTIKNKSMEKWEGRKAGGVGKGGGGGGEGGKWRGYSKTTSEATKIRERRSRLASAAHCKARRKCAKSTNMGKEHICVQRNVCKEHIRRNTLHHTRKEKVHTQS
jgi:uncharacterized membrane protein YgcG